MRIKYQHKYGKSDAYARVSTLLNGIRQQYQDSMEIERQQWNAAHDRMDFQLSAIGSKITGIITLSDNRVVLDAKLPLAARLFQGTLEKKIKEELDRAFL